MRKSLFSFLSIAILILLTSIVSAQWQALNSGISTRLHAIKAVDENVLWACGSSGVVLRSVDGGQTWVKKTVTNGDFINYSMDALDSNTALVAATNGSTSVDFRIYKTTDGGKTWSQKYQNENSFSDGIRFLGPNYAYAYGDPTPGSKHFVVVVTTDGGNTWTRTDTTKLPEANIAQGEFGATNALEVFGKTVWFGTASDGSGFVPRVYRGDYQNTTWTASEPITGVTGYIFSINFKSETEGILVTSSGKGARTTDGGKTWKAFTISDGSFFRWIKYVPGTDAIIAVGGMSGNGVTYYSLDDGQTWKRATDLSVRLRSVAATAGNKLWAVGDDGAIYKWNGPTLPVELTSFTAASEQGRINLNWSTATETNNKGFEIERKIVTRDNSGTWQMIGFREGKGTRSEITNYSFIDELKGVNAESVVYRLKQVDYNAQFHYSAEVTVKNIAPANFSLSQNYPNPFNPSTLIKYALPIDSRVKLTIFNSVGQEIKVLVNDVKSGGVYDATWSAAGLSSGIYFYNLQAIPLNGDKPFSITKKMTLVK